ncbi:MAG: divalent-cation tolerance protein CutA [Cyanobacteria bacterium SID2]|nr:divalent-cation tolerance protein CutA [Cyanobacteria bacterium SID2]MBP0003210.1 divalent-cation tolerance protein CutA [Cyanobacteria bacterium SBC]
MTDYGIVLVTAGSPVEAKSLARSLVEGKFAACVSLFPVRSIYTWQDRIEDEEEWQLVIKTDLSQFDRLEAYIREQHSYEVPEIVAFPIVKGSEPYLNWIAQTCSVS